MNEAANHDHNAAESSPGWRRYTKPAAALAVILALFVLSRFFDVRGMLLEALDWVDQLGWIGYLVFVLLYIVASVFLVPGSILTLGAGAIYGLLEGFLVVSVASTLGATAAFIVGRYFARDWIARKIVGNEKFTAVDDAVGREGWKIVGLTRLSPIFPFTLLNYAYGLTRVSLRDYVLASWIGMMPGTVMYVYLGSLAGSVAKLGTEEESQRSTGEWVLLIVGLIATVAVTVLVTRVASKALSQEVGEVAVDESGE